MVHKIKLKNSVVRFIIRKIFQGIQAEHSLNKQSKKNGNLFYLCFTHSIKKGFQLLGSPLFVGSGNWTRTSDLRVMSSIQHALKITKH